MAAKRFSQALHLDGFGAEDFLPGDCDDICAGATESFILERAIGTRSSGRSLVRSCSFESWRRQEGGEEGRCIVLDAPPKFLQLQAELEGERDDADPSWFKSPASVPFEWEEAPGNPRAPEPADSNPVLKLPPRLLARSCSISRSDPSTTSCSRRSITYKQGMFLGADGRTGSLCSPTSILHGPDTSSSSYSGSPGSEADAGTGTSARGSSTKKKKGSIMKAVDKVLRGNWLRKKKKFRGSEAAELWTPTYFRSLEAAKAKEKDEVVVSRSNPAVLFRSSARRWIDLDQKSAPIRKSDVGESDFEDVEVASWGCPSPSPMVALPPRLARSASTGEHRRRLTAQRRKGRTKRMEKISNFFETFIHKAVSSIRPRPKA